MNDELTQTQAHEKVLTQKMRVALMAHFQLGAPIDRLNLSPQQKDIVARVAHVYWQWVKNPFLDCHMLLYQLHKNAGRGTGGNSTLLAHRDMRVLEFVRDNMAPPSRRVSEAQVRAAGKKLMTMGMATDNGRDIEAGAKIIMKLDRLDQPESEHADLSKAVFLPPVVVTDVTEVDPTKERVDDAEVERIMNKYGGYIDEKRTMVEEHVKLLEASSPDDAQEVVPEEVE